MHSDNEINHEHPSVQRILLAARGCFGRMGYKGASMSLIAREAEVSKSLLHYHFDKKEKLFVEVQLLLMRDLLQRVRTAANGPATVESFGRALDEVMNFVETDIDSMRVLLEFHHAAQASPDVAARLTEFNDEVNTLVVDGIRNIMGPLTERLFIEPERLSRLLRTLFNGLILELVYTEGDDARELTRETFADVRALIARVLFKEVS